MSTGYDGRNPAKMVTPVVRLSENVAAVKSAWIIACGDDTEIDATARIQAPPNKAWTLRAEGA
jgi:hypothetical protein